MAKKYGHLVERTRCRLCRESVKDVDYKNVSFLEKYTARNGKIAARKRSGTCARHQRKLKKAIFRARFIGLMPYTAV